MSGKLVLFENADFQDSKLYRDVESIVFDQGNFIITLPDSTIERFFEDKTRAISNFREFEPVIERFYFDLEKWEIRSLVVSFYTQDDHVQYGLIVHSYDQYKLMFSCRHINQLDTAQNDANLIDAMTNKSIVKLACDQGFAYLTSFVSNTYYDGFEHIYYVSPSKCPDELISILNCILAPELGCEQPSAIKYASFMVDVCHLEMPYLMKADFTYQDKKYEYWIDENRLNEIKSLMQGDVNPCVLDVFLDAAVKQFVEENIHIINDTIRKKRVEASEKLFSSIYKKYTFKKYAEGRYGYVEFGDIPCIYFQEDEVQIRLSRNINQNEIQSFSFTDIDKQKENIKKTIDGFILTHPIEVDAFIKDGQAFLTSNDALDEATRIGKDLLERYLSLPSYDRGNKDLSSLHDKIKSKVDKLLHFDKSKASLALELMRKIIDVESYDRYSDDLFDALDELDEGEQAAIKAEYDAFLEKFGDLPDYHADEKAYRRVYIRKSALERLQRLNLEQKDLKILAVMDDIVDCLKTLPGNQLGRYLLNKGLNFPIKNDRSVKKIRIMRNAKYRILFVYGSDLNDDERINNLDSIYIFGITEHKKDKVDLYREASKKPTKYEINDFIIYPRNKIVKIPECTSAQYQIATAYEDQPVITFGCAGSGKTTVSIEQYVNIVYTRFGCKSPSPEELVYITFHKGLSEKVKKDLAEFKIEGNCYKLDEYFCYVIGEAYDSNKTISEVTFSSWFERTYSETEIQKNRGKKKTRIAPLKDKPDIARLLYTYYRGVFKGSKELQYSKINYLDETSFLAEMSGETYLSESEKKAIYTICKEFDDYASSNGLWSDNDYALKVIRQASFGIKRTNCIIIDEVQDLTEIEILATILTLKQDSTRIYFYGDPHQSINPNVFDSSTINGVYSSLGKTTSSVSAPLTITYRTNRHLISYLNELLKHRDEWIGLTKGGLSSIVEPPVTDENTSWAGYVTNPALYQRIFESNPNSMIITPSESVRKKLLEKYPEIEKARAITIYDAKGMEWDTIIMYNMFTDYEPYFMDMISGNGKAKKSTIHRMTFNKFYVGCTRSTKSFVIIEENNQIFDMNHPIFTNLLSSFAPIYKKEQIDTYILEENTFEAWYKEALQNLDNENTATFDHALAHARRLAKTQEDIKMVNDLLDSNPETLLRYGFQYLEQGEYDLSRSAFLKANKQTKAHGPYILLTAVLSGKNLSDEHLREFLKCPELIEKYPQVLEPLMKQPAFKARLKRCQAKLLEKENNNG